MTPVRLFLLLCLMMPKAWAFSWQDLWATQNQQAQALMHAHHYDEAETLFEDPAWQATAAFRAKHFADAAKLYHALNDHYNEGNALAHKGDLKTAVKAYDKALALDPKHADALYNKKIVETLLQKEKDKQEQDQEKQEQGKQDQDKQEQDQQEQDKQEQDKQEQDKQEQDKQDQDKQEQDKPEQDKPDQTKPDNKTAAESQAEQERQQENEQWLRLIPDDPGGLMREKFRRDYLRTQNGWY